MSPDVRLAHRNSIAGKVVITNFGADFAPELVFRRELKPKIEFPKSKNAIDAANPRIWELTQLIHGFGLRWSARLDLNQRPHAPQACALPDCATRRHERVNLRNE